MFGNINLRINREQFKNKLDLKDGKTPIAGVDFPLPKDGKDGKDGESIIGPPGSSGKDGADGSPDTPEQIRDKLTTLKKEDRLSKDAIKGLDEYLDRSNVQKLLDALWQRTQFLINRGSTTTTTSVTGSSLVNISDPDPTPQEGLLTINSLTNEMKVYYLGAWRLLHTLAAADSFYLMEDGTSMYLLENGTDMYILE